MRKSITARNIKTTIEGSPLMKTIALTTLKLAAAAALITSLAACAGLSRQQTHAAIGAGAGGALGYVLTGGPVGTIAGAAAGGLIGAGTR
jgi:osmotically inducible lipoprotein OsmB